MNYLIIYCDKENNMLKEIYTSAAISLSRIHANLIAYKNERTVVDIKIFTYEDILLTALKDNDINKVLEVISIFNEDERNTLNGLKELAINAGIHFEESELNNNIKQTLYIDDYIINLYAELNAYGMIDLEFIEVLNKSNMILMNKEIDYGKKRAV